MGDKKEYKILKDGQLVSKGIICDPEKEGYQYIFHEQGTLKASGILEDGGWRQGFAGEAENFNDAFEKVKVEAVRKWGEHTVIKEHLA
jgi:hypothetical protein